MNRNPFEEVEFTAEETAIIDHWLSTGQPRPTYPATACKVRESTPITPEGLRGLGMTAHMVRHRVEIGDVTLDVWPSGLAIVSPSAMGTAPDLETVGRLIEVLRRMNGGGA